MGKKQLLAKLLCQTRLIRLLGMFSGVSVDDIRILAYHRVYDMGVEDEFPYDPELISATVDDFRWQMSLLKSQYNPITFETMLQHMKEGKSLPAKSVIVTFDDGHEDNHRFAFPVLKELGVPATIFLSTEYMDTNKIFWFDFVANLTYRLPVGEYQVPGLPKPINITDDVAARRAECERVLGDMKLISNQGRLDAIEYLQNNFGHFCDSTEGTPISGPMNWDQVREMSANGIEFGSHTVSHPILAKLDSQSLKWELEESKAAIEKHTGKIAHVIAYPVGGKSHTSAEVFKMAETAGYDIGTTYISGVSRIDWDSRFQFERLHVERYTTREDFEAMLALPAIFH